MGMYTELVLKADIKQDIPLEIKSVLRFMFNGDDKPSNLPEHPFFKTPRWDFVGSCSSYYHIPWATSKYEDDYLFSRSDIKNYNDELELFIDWLTPYLGIYVEAEEEVCIGWTWYEDSDKPDLIMVKGE